MENQKPFAASKIVSVLFNNYNTNPLVLTPNENEQFPCNDNLVNKALLKLCIMWNKDEKSRNFTKHLIGNFLPEQTFNKVGVFTPDVISENKNIDCLLGIKLAGLVQISQTLSDINIKRLEIEFDAISEKRKLNPTEMKALGDLTHNLPLEIRKASFAYFSPNSDKFICRESMRALRIFTEYCILNDEKEVLFMINKKRLSEMNKNNPEKQQLNNKQINNVVKSSTFGIDSFLDSDTLNKLKAMTTPEPAKPTEVDE